jgi:polyisoprenoid-binding protein YceI
MPGRMVGQMMVAGALALAIPGTARAQHPDPLRGGRAAERTSADAFPPADEPALTGAVDPRLRDLDSVTYRLARTSRLQVKTGTAGLFGFAGHAHLIQARAFRGEVVYHPKEPARSRVAITIVTDSLEVLTPPDTAEIRKVTKSMKEDVLHTGRYPTITLVSRAVTPTATGFHLVAAVTMAGRTREVPMDVTVGIGTDSLEAATAFVVKQSDFGIKPYSGGPGGTVKVADKVAFGIRAVAIRADGAAAGTR